MNLKHYLAAIFSAAILSISFLACDPKEDDPTPNPTPSTDVVKEVYGFYGKSESQVLPLLDAKGWRKSVDTSSLGVVYTYLSIDSNKMYSVYSTNNVIYSVSYGEAEKTMMYNGKLASNTNRLLSLFEKWEQSLSTVNISNSTFQGSIIADEFEFVQEYEDRATFLNYYQTKKPTIDAVKSQYSNLQFRGYIYAYLDYNTEDSFVYVVFDDNIIWNLEGKTTQNHWFRRLKHYNN
ncbi:hypothetical protein SDC9_22765 [bioreactor metagenome]|uniref:Lipoprotein n=1 Tax=bioreactor metagenome TaxID=1076179 RepID=A0A644UDD8_9ZZZZ